MFKRLSTTVAGLTTKTRKRMGLSALPFVVVMTDAVRLPDPTLIIKSLPVHSALIIRHPSAEGRRSLARSAIGLCRAGRVSLLISEDWREAARLRGVGVHVPESSLPNLSAGLRLWRRATKALVTSSAHGLAGLKAAQRAQIDLVFLSPVLPTESHPGRAHLGAVRFAAWARLVDRPVAALGGVNQSTLRRLNGTRYAAIAGVSFAAEKK